MSVINPTSMLAGISILLLLLQSTFADNYPERYGHVRNKRQVPGQFTSETILPVIPINEYYHAQPMYQVVGNELALDYCPAYFVPNYANTYEYEKVKDVDSCGTLVYSIDPREHAKRRDKVKGEEIATSVKIVGATEIPEEEVVGKKEKKKAKEDEKDVTKKKEVKKGVENSQ